MNNNNLKQLISKNSDDNKIYNWSFLIGLPLLNKPKVDPFLVDLSFNSKMDLIWKSLKKPNLKCHCTLCQQIELFGFENDNL